MYVHPDVLDPSIAYLIANTTALLLCSQEPTSYIEATTTFALARKNAPSISGPSNGITAGGRKLTIAAFSQPSAPPQGTTGTGVGVCYALVNTAASKLLLVADVVADVACVAGTAFNMTADLTVELPGLS